MSILNRNRKLKSKSELHPAAAARQQRKSIFPRLSRQKSNPNLPTRANRDMGKSVRTKRQRGRLSGLVGGAASTLASMLRSIWVLIVLVIGIILLSVFIWYMHESGTYVLEEIEISGNYQIPTEELESKLVQLMGQSMFSFSSTGIENSLLNDFSYLKSVQVQKQLPGTLIIEIEERFSTLVYFNPAGAYVLDEEGVVVSIVVSTNVRALSRQEEQVMNGYGDPNATYVYQRYLAALDTEQERDGVDWEEVPEVIKESTLALLRKELSAYVESRLESYRDSVGQSEFAELLRLEGFDASLNEAGEKYYRAYELGEEYSSDSLRIVMEIVDYLKNEKLPASQLRWESEFTLRVRLRNGVVILFSRNKPVSEQLLILHALREQRIIRSAQEIDLRSELVSVK